MTQPTTHDDDQPSTDGSATPTAPVRSPAPTSAEPGAVNAAAEAAEAERAVEEDVQALRQSLSEGENRYLRLAADFENYRRRKDQELLDRRRYASEEAALALLPVLDNLRRAVEHAPEGGAEDFFVNGLHLVVREFEAGLERLGVTRVPGVGEPFDPAVHEAIGGQESDTVDRDTVIDELLPGYRLHDRLLRPSMVRIAHARRSDGPG
jgi:molecular chaperone GrpE